MEASKGDMPEEPAPESLPAESAEAKPKKTMMLAVIIVVILIVAAIGGAFALGIVGGKKNKAPVAGAEITSPTNTVAIGGSVSFKSTSTDPENDITEYQWYFGDGTNSTGADLVNVTHQYDLGGAYWVYLVVKDGGGKTADTEASMLRVFVTIWDPIAAHKALTNDTAPCASLIADKDVVVKGTAVTFDASSSYAIGGWHLAADNVTSLYDVGWQYLNSVTIDFGDGSAVQTITPAESMKATHTYAESGHYAAKLTVTSNYSKSTSVMLTIHVLKEAITTGIKNPGSLIIAEIGEPEYLDPAVDYETGGGELLQNVYETLVFYDGASAVNLKPVLATEVPTYANNGISADGMNYTFNLRSGVKFHNGEVMTADDVVYSFQRVLRIHDPGGPSWMFEQIATNYLSYYIGDELQNFTSDSQGVQLGPTPQWVLDVLGGNTSTYVLTEKDNQNVSEASITKVDNDTLKIRLTVPYPGFLQICAYTVLDVVSKKFITDNKPDVNGQQNDFLNINTCGTGPYKLVKWDAGSKYYCTRFDDYWGTKPALKDVYVIKATDVNTRILMLQGGDADIANMDIAYDSLFAGKSEYYISRGNQTLSLDFLAFNQKINISEASKFGSTVPATFFTDKNLRLAFSYMFNYGQYLANVRKGNAIQPNGFIPKGMWGYNASAAPLQTFDLVKARQYLENATNPATNNSWWTDGFTIALFYNAGNQARESACQYLKESLESLGSQFKATINTLDWPTYLKNQRGRVFPLFSLGWAPDYNDPDDYAVPFAKSTGTFASYTSFRNATLNDLASLAATETNLTKRQAYYDNMTDLLYNQCVYMWLAQPNNYHIERSWMHGFVFNPMYSGWIWSDLTKS